MRSAAVQKSVKEVSRRRARMLFTVATLALAVASFGFLAVPTLIDRSMQEEVRDGRLAHLTVGMRPLPLTDAQLAALAALPNVEALEARSTVDTRVLVGERRAPAQVIGVRDFGAQQVDVVRVESGSLPQPGEVLADVQDANVGLYDGAAGDTLRVVGVTGRERVDLPVSGRGRSLPGGEVVQDGDLIVLYAHAATVAALSGDPGYNALALRLRDPSPEAAEATVAAVRSSLEAVPGFSGFRGLPELRAPGEWPGKEELAAFTDFLTVIALFALLSAVVLISNTMTTLVAEQTGEIGIMRAVGARRRQVALVYLRTALLLGGLGAVVGTALGIGLAYLLAGYFGDQFWAVDVAFGLDPAVVVLSLLVGLVAPPLAALPAIRRGSRVDLRVALESTGSAVGDQDAGDRLLRRARFLPRTAQIGLRGVGRRKRRSLATALIVALAVGNMLALMGLADAATESTRTAWGSHREDVRFFTAGRDLFDARAEQAVRGTPGVAAVQPALVTGIELEGREAVVWGVVQEPMLDYRITGGRWFTKGEERRRERVGVLERNLAELAGVAVGDRVSVKTAAGTIPVRIVGIAKNQQEEGTALYMPLGTVRAAMGSPAATDTYWIAYTSSDEPFVDRTTTAIENRLAALGYEVWTEITYVAERDEVAENRSLTTTITMLSLVIVAISMVGLANAITTSVIERTREIGILRCIGARARDVRRIFATEGLVLALAGGLLGIPLGYLLNRLLVWLVWEIADVRIPVVYPLANIPVALLGTTVIALLVLLLPVRRAVRARPGDALRYA
jgi:putative ABC transport system permease protein